MVAPVVTAPARAAPPSRERRGRLWAALAAPGIVWLAAFFIFPLYVVLCIVFGQVDPIFRTPVPVWNPLQWDPTQFTYVLTHIVGSNGVYGPAIVRTFIFVLVASSLCLLIAFPVAYYVARLSGKRRGLIDARREGPRRLVGKYINLNNPEITVPWVGLVVSDQRIDGYFSLGRVDFRR